MKNTKGLIIGILVIVILVILIVISGKKSGEQGATAPTKGGTIENQPPANTTATPVESGTNTGGSDQNGVALPVQPGSNTGIPSGQGDQGQTSAVDSSDELSSLDAELKAIDVSASSDSELNSIDQEVK